MKKLTNTEFELRSRRIHGDLYDYSKVKYQGNKINVDIICSQHGVFKQQPRAHINNKSGCPKCSKLKQGISNKMNLLDSRYKNIIQPKEYKIIPLTKGKFAKVDNEDFDLLSKYNWSITVFKYCANFELGRMHRFITNCPDDLEVDHINHDTLDNRRCNLRICNGSENTSNRHKLKKSTSKYKGVYWNNKYSKWQACVQFKYKKYHLGLFDKEIDAAIAYNKGAIIHQGQFAKLNKL